MITKVQLSSLQNQQTIQKVSFAGNNSYNTIANDIDIYSETVNNPVKTVSGDVEIENTIIKSGIQTVSGDIDISNSTVENGVNTVSGDVNCKEVKIITGDIETVSGDIHLRNSYIKENIKSKSGMVKMRDSIIGGTIEANIGNLKLNGENEIKALVLQDSAESNSHATKMVFSDMNGENCIIFNNNNRIKNIIINGGKISSPNADIKLKTPEFILPRGSKILEMIKFDTSKPGILYLEEGAELLGKIINGVIKRIR